MIKGLIYGIKCNTTGLLYIGSTKNTLNYRLSRHKTDLKGYMGINKKPRNYRSSFEVLFNDNYNIFKIEEFECATIEDLNIREALWIKKYWDKCVNKRLPIKLKDDHDFSVLPLSSVDPCPSLI